MATMTPKKAYDKCLKNYTRNKELEKIIIEDPKHACLYAKDIIAGRWLEAENIIATSAEWAFYYSSNVIYGRWGTSRAKMEAEESIKKDPQYAYRYAREVIRGRWIEAEPYIIKDSLYACYYAADIIKDRWIEAEKSIAECTNDDTFDYLKDFVKDRWPELEEKLLKTKSSRKIVKYCKIINQRWIEAEPIIAHNMLVDYCNHFSIPLPEENYNKELLECAIHSKSSKYFNKIKKEKDAVIRLLKSLVIRQEISLNQTVEDLIK